MDMPDWKSWDQSRTTQLGWVLGGFQLGSGQKVCDSILDQVKGINPQCTANFTVTLTMKKSFINSKTLTFKGQCTRAQGLFLIELLPYFTSHL